MSMNKRFTDRQRAIDGVEDSNLDDVAKDAIIAGVKRIPSSYDGPVRIISSGRNHSVNGARFAT